MIAQRQQSGKSHSMTSCELSPNKHARVVPWNSRFSFAPDDFLNIEGRTREDLSWNSIIITKGDEGIIVLVLKIWLNIGLRRNEFVYGMQMGLLPAGVLPTLPE